METNAKTNQGASREPELDRRQALAKLGLGAAIAYAVPIVSTLSRRAHASGGEGGGEGGGGEGGGGSGGGGSGGSGGGGSGGSGGSGGDAGADGGSGGDAGASGGSGAETDDGSSATGPGLE